MQNLIFIVGKTSSGKDTVAKYLSERYGIPAICSYTTRPKRDYEEDGVQHYFINKETMREIMENDDIIAYTKFPKTGIEYCATANSIAADTASYIIDPNGIEWFKKNGCSANISYFSIYVDLKEDVIVKRALERGDDVKTIEERLDSERESFNGFKFKKKFTYYVSNKGDLEDLYQEIDKIILKEL